MTRDERVMLAAYRCLYPDAVDSAASPCLRADAAPLSPMLNHIVGLGVDEPATEAALDAALAAIGDDVTCYVAVAPEARPGRARRLAAGARPRAGLGLDGVSPWRRGRPRTADTAPPRPSRPRRSRSLRPDRRGGVRPAGRRRALGSRRRTSWAGIAGSRSTATSPPPRPASSSTEGVGYLGFAATLPEHRGKGGAERTARRPDPACTRGAAATSLVTETGERRDDLPSNSYRNILRAGFTEVAVTANWLAPGPTLRRNPVTSHRRRRKRAPISTSRVRISTDERRPDAAHTPVRLAATASSAPRRRRTPPPSTAPGSARRSPRSGSRRARRRSR